jgi:hypothetical protein
MVTAHGVERAKSLLVIDAAKDLPEQKRPIALVDAIQLRAKAGESLPVRAHGHCFLVAKLDSPSATSISILVTIAQNTAPIENAIVVLDSGQLVAFFQPIYGAADMRLEATFQGQKKVTLLSPTLHTMESWRLSGQKL